MSILFDISNSRSSKLRQGVGSMVQMWSWFDDSDYIGILLIEKSGFLLHCFFDISNTRSLKLRHGVSLLRSHVLNNCHVSPWFMTYMCLACWISLTLVITWLCHVFLADVVYWRESGRRSRSHLDLTVHIQLGFHTSRFRDSWSQYFLTSPTVDPRNLKMVLDQRST